MKNVGLRSLFSVCLAIFFPLFSRLCEGADQSPSFSLKPLYEVVTLGAPTTGSLIEGIVGAIHKGCRHRFHCYSAEEPIAGLLSSQTMVKPLSMEDQPGVFPAPLMGPASLTFTFNCHDSQLHVTPVVVRPDGTVFNGLPMTSLDSPQTLIISAPAQTGIYTLFALVHQKTRHDQMTITASVSTQPQQNKTLYLQPFDLFDKNIDQISSEFVYSP